MDFDIPREIMLPVEHIDVALDPAPHPFEATNLAAIDSNWERELAANPALFDGRVSLLARLGYRDRWLEGLGPPGPLRHLHVLEQSPARAAHRALLRLHHASHVRQRTGGGPYGPRTATPGCVYFASGSFERDDFPGGRVNVDLNMAREVREETGLDISGLSRDRFYHIWSVATVTAIVRRYWLPMTAIEAETSIRASIGPSATSGDVRKRRRSALSSEPSTPAYRVSPE
jgi:hypothetical protein